jgi:hypothetical protein
MMRTLLALPALAALVIALVALPAEAGTKPGDHRGDKRGHGHAKGKHRSCGRERRREPGYTVILDGSRRCFAQWRYAGGASATLQRDGTVRTGAGDGLGVLWFAARPYGDFSLRLQFRDDAPGPVRANSGVQVRFPAPKSPTPGCPTTFNGSEQDNPAWVAVNCGHEIQINDSADGGTADARKTGSIYGFDDLDAAQAHVTPAGTWNELEITVVGQHYTIKRDGVVINEYENVPGVKIPGRPNDPDSSSRGLVGYIGLQAHGGEDDIVSFRNVRIRDLEVDG